LSSQDVDQAFGCLACYLDTHNSGSRTELLAAFSASYHPKDGTPVLPIHLDRCGNWKDWTAKHNFYNNHSTFKNMHNHKLRKFLFKRGIQTVANRQIDNVSCQVKTADSDKLAYM
jgi:hypothetical protein